VVSSCELSNQHYPQFQTIHYPGAFLYQKGNLSHADTFKMPLSVIEPIIYGEIPANQLIDNLTLHPDPMQIAVQLEDIDNLDVGEQCFTEVSQETPKIPSNANLIDNILNIRILANDGEQQKALDLCNETIEKNKLDKALYFLRASILQELGRDIEAIGSLKQVIYLDQDCIMGHFCLGNLYNQEGRQMLAKKYFNAALNLLKDKPDDEVLSESEGLSVKYMREIIISSISKFTIL
jgi:tetratricopeptide (TPR) repeat protein